MPHQGPARDHIGEPGDVLLGVDAAHAERMQLEDLAGEIFVEAALLPQAGERVRDRSSAHCRDRSASPDGIRPPAACRRSARAHARGWLRARRRRRSGAHCPCPPTRRNGSTRTRPAVRRNRSRRRARHRSAPWLHRDKSAAARRDRDWAWARPARPADPPVSCPATRRRRLARWPAAWRVRRAGPRVAPPGRQMRRARPDRSAAGRHRDAAGAGAVQIGEQRAARVGGNGGDRSGARTDAEPVQGKRSFGLWIKGHASMSSRLDATPPP